MRLDMSALPIVIRVTQRLVHEGSAVKRTLRVNMSVVQPLRRLIKTGAALQS